MYILGINAFHGDSAAALVHDGRVVAAAEEERFRRVKHWAGFPSESVAYCLQEAGIGLSDLDSVAINQDGRANLRQRLSFAVAVRPDLGTVLDRLRNRRERSGVDEHLAKAFPGQKLKAKVRHVEHHLAHLASAYLVSPFDEATVVSIDGFGDFASAAWAHASGNVIDVQDKVYFPHSLGIFYQAMTQYLGFPNYGDEYKVMGLAPYGKPTFLAQMRDIVRLRADGTFELALKYFRHDKERVEMEWDNGEPKVGILYSDALPEFLGSTRGRGDELTQRHHDLASSIQAMYEEAMFHLLNRLHEQHRSDNVAIAGGCGMNSVANGKIKLKTPFKKVYVQSAAGDAGGAIGAAMAIWAEDAPSQGGHFHMDHAYFGPGCSEDEVSALLAEQADSIQAAGCTVRRVDDEAALVEEVAVAISEGLVIGWFQGRMEWGPRALGNRSILADPRRADMKDILNLKIKRRESFRPFAPSVMRRAVPEWFETDDDVPFMMQVYQVRESQRGRIPAVTHVDGSGRLQTVYAHTNPRYHALIAAFERLTGVPMVLNTSFNENEPVVCRPREALDCFLRTRMDLLVLGNWVLRRPS